MTYQTEFAILSVSSAQSIMHRELPVLLLTYVIKHKVRSGVLTDTVARYHLKTKDTVELSDISDWPILCQIKQIVGRFLHQHLM